MRVRILFFLLFLPFLATAQLYEIKKGNKWGLMDRKGKVILPAGYDYLYPDSLREYFFTRKGRKTGLFHIEKGNLVEPVYDLIYPPTKIGGNFFKVADDGAYGILDSMGNEFISPDCNEITSLDKGYFYFRKGKYWGLKSAHFGFRIPPKYLVILKFYKEDKRFFLGTNEEGFSTIWNQTGQVIADNIKYAVEDIVCESFVYKSDKKYGLLNKSGQPVTDPSFDAFFKVGQMIAARKGVSYGLFDPTGNRILKPEYRSLREDSTDRVWFADSSKWGVVGLDGQIIAIPQFAKSGYFYGPVARVQNDTAYGVLNITGGMLAPQKYHEIRFYPGMVRARRDTIWDQILFDEKGKPLKRKKLIIAKSKKEFEYGAARALYTKNSVERLGWFFYKGRWGLRDTTTGEVVFKPIYGSVEILDKYGLSLVTSASKLKRGQRIYGLIDHGRGKQIAPTEYEHFFLSDLEEGNVFRGLKGVDYGRRMVLIADTGKVIRVPNAIFIAEPKDGIFRVKMKGKRHSLSRILNEREEMEKEFIKYPSVWKMVDSNGKTIKPKVQDGKGYPYIGPINQGIAIAHTREAGKKNYVIIDTSMEVVGTPTLHQLTELGGNSPFIQIHKDTFTFNLLDSTGQFLLSRNSFWMDADSQKKVITEIGSFSEGLISLKAGGKWGFMNTKGEVVIDPKYRTIKDFHQGLAAFRGKKGWGYINKFDEIIIKPKYKQARDFHFDRAAVRNSKGWGFIHKNGKRAIKFKMRKAMDFSEELGPAKLRYWGLIDLDGNWIVKPIYGMLEKNGEYWRVRKDGRFGFLENNGDTYIEPKYFSLGVMSEGRISFQKKARLGFVDMNGEEVIPASYRNVKPFSNELAAVMYGGRWGYIDKEGHTIINHEYRDAKSFVGFVAPVADYKTGKWGVIDTVGKTILPFDFDKILRSPEGWLACLSSQDEAVQWTFYDPKGIRLSHQNYEDGSEFKVGLAMVKEGDRKNVINIFGIPLTYPGYDDILDMGGEAIVAESNEMVGLWDREGNEVLPPQYEFIEYIDGMYRVVHHGDIGYFHPGGVWIYPLSSQND